MRSLRLGASLVVFTLVGCGGGGGGGGTSHVTLSATSALSGIVSSAGQVVHGFLIVGDNASTPTAAHRGFVSFDLASIPPGATIRSATLRLRQGLVFGNPYTSLGSIFVDEVVYGSVLDPGSYDRAFPFGSAFGALSTNAVIEEKSVDATAAVREAVSAGRAQAQFRLRFPTENDGDADDDQAYFHPASDPSLPEDPKLDVVYDR